MDLQATFIYLDWVLFVYWEMLFNSELWGLGKDEHFLAEFCSLHETLEGFTKLKNFR